MTHSAVAPGSVGEPSCGWQPRSVTPSVWTGRRGKGVRGRLRDRDQQDEQARDGRGDRPDPRRTARRGDGADPADARGRTDEAGAPGWRVRSSVRARDGAALSSVPGRSCASCSASASSGTWTPAHDLDVDLPDLSASSPTLVARDLSARRASRKPGLARQGAAGPAMPATARLHRHRTYHGPAGARPYTLYVPTTGSRPASARRHAARRHADRRRLRRRHADERAGRGARFSRRLPRAGHLGQRDAVLELVRARRPAPRRRRAGDPRRDRRRDRRASTRSTATACTSPGSPPARRWQRCSGRRTRTCSPRWACTRGCRTGCAHDRRVGRSPPCGGARGRGRSTGPCR